MDLWKEETPGGHLAGPLILREAHSISESARTGPGSHSQVRSVVRPGWKGSRLLFWPGKHGEQ